jgi:uncharacterized hydrophobic protein (TIGR00271 family)
VLHLIAFVRPELTDEIREGLEGIPGVRHLIIGGLTTEGLVNLTAQMEPRSADQAIDLLARLDVDADNVSFLRLPVLQPLGWKRRRSSDPDAQVWAEVIAKAQGNARLGRADLLFMMAAGVIAGVGVLTGSSILVVGAMAISPDMLPITASAVGLVQRRWRLAARAGRTLAVGLGTSALAACGATLILRAIGRIDTSLRLAETVLGPSLTTLGPGSILVAIAAGVAGILAYERVGGAAVGVAISVTTIPAAAYVGAAVAMGRSEPMTGALLVLVTNVVFIVAASTATLWFQRAFRIRRNVAEPSPTRRV